MKVKEYWAGLLRLHTRRLKEDPDIVVRGKIAAMFTVGLRLGFD